jgi:MFS family permease
MNAPVNLDSERKIQLARRITLTLFLAQSLVSGALIAMATVNAIAGAELSRVAVWAGVPGAVLLLATAIGAYIWGMFMERFGRRPGLMLGSSLGVLGAVISAQAIRIISFPLFLLGMAFLGLAQAAMTLGRFAAAEVHPPPVRGRAIANIVLGGTIGAILGPLLVGPASEWMGSLGRNELSGAYIVGLALFALALGVIALLLRPEPKALAYTELSDLTADNTGADVREPLNAIIQRPGVAVPVITMVIGQLVMVMLMVITSLHMKGLGHSLADVSFVISAHTFGMFAFSFISGRLSDRLGREPVIYTGAAVLVLASLSARFSIAVPSLAGSLFALGLGWNLCFVAGSALLTDHLSAAEQTRVQGFNDLLVGLASALGSLGSGVVFAALGYRAMGLVAAGLAGIPILATSWWQRYRRHPHLAAAQPPPPV